MSKRFGVLLLAIAGCGVEVDGAGAESGEPVEKTVSAITYANGHDYFFVQTPMKWNDARFYCQNLGHLVTLGDSGENAFVAGQVAQHGGGAWWIGRSDQVTETFWKWDSNELLRFDNWAAGQPDNFNNEDCATMDGSGLWNDLTCGALQRFVCERDAAPLATTLNFVYGTTNTSSDTQNFRVGQVDLVTDQMLTIGTCGLPNASATGDTFLRLFDPTNTVEITSNDDACGGVGSNFTVVPHTAGRYNIRMGCFGSGTCSGTVMIRPEGIIPPH